MADTKKTIKIKLDNLFDEQDIKKISNSIARAIRISLKEKVNKILKALKK